MTLAYAFGKTRRHRVTLGVQAAITDKEGRILLVRHGYRPGWHFPGGGVERGETLRSALERELEEETGIALIENAALIGIYAHFDAFPGDHIVLYAANRWQRLRVPTPNSEIAEQGFFHRDALPPGVVPQTRKRLDELFEGVPRSAHW